MGVQITELLARHVIKIEDLAGKKLSVDAFNTIYQFLTTIRQRDGTPLMDSKGRITSHLTGLFSRTTKLMENNIKLCFVFDGKPPKLKETESARRRGLKEEAALKHKEAVQKKDVEGMKKYASRTARLTDEMIKESKELISALGLPIVQAPSEGEAQAALMVKKGDVWAVVSQDTDSLLFGADRLVRNLSISGRRKKTSKLAYETVQPEIVKLDENLKTLGINQDQLIALAILVGTDYNPGGVKGIGPKKGLQLVKEYRTDFDAMFKKAGWDFPFEWNKPFDLIKKMPTITGYKLNWSEINRDKVMEILCEQHDFDRERILKKLDDLEAEKSKKKQKGLSEWF
ncbi:flap endonuclease-1 [Candidatus Woesearchaeota archaeon]|nr:flap endonuclease-1 [Candidatus Woesearchaeota archaeon]